MRHDSLSFFKTRMLGGAPGVQEYVRSRERSWKWWDETGTRVFHPWSIVTLVTPADSFEVGRPETGSIIRVRTWWHTDKQLMRFPLVTLRELSVDGRPVEFEQVEKHNRKGAITGSYYRYELGSRGDGAFSGAGVSGAAGAASGAAAGGIRYKPFAAW